MIDVSRVTWESVRDDLAETFVGDEPEIKQDVVTGRAFCWRVGSVAMIARREGAELVIMCIAGAGLQEVAPVIIEAARRAGCKTIRFHTHRPAMGRLLRPFGFELSETIFRAEL